MKNEQQPTDALAQLLNNRQRDALHQAGIYNLRLEEDGTLSGERIDTSWYPQVDYVRNITVTDQDGTMIVSGDVIDHADDIGKVI